MAVNDNVLMASKSCSVNIEADVIKVSSATDAEWEHNMAGRRSWSISTNHLLRAVSRESSVMTTFDVVARSWMDPNNKSYCKVGSDVRYLTSRGLMLVIYQYSNGLWSYYTGDIYDTYEDGCQDMENDITTLLSEHMDRIALITSNDAYMIDQGLAGAITTLMKVPVNSVPDNQNGHGAFCAIGGPGINGIAYSQAGRAGYAHASLNTIAGGDVPSSPIKDNVQMIGQQVRLQLSVDGYGKDTLTGNATVKSFRVHASSGNLMSGVFEFVGTGPLE